MRFQKFMLCVAVALTAFGVSLGLMDIGRYLKTAFEMKKPEVKTVQPVIEKETAVLPPLLPKKETIFPTRFENPSLIPAVTEVKTEEKSEPDYVQEGYFYSIGDLPEGFKDFHYFFVSFTDFARASEENDYQYLPIPPEGHIILENKNFEFTRISVGKNRISFETETIKGISYKFTGEFIEDEEITAKTTDGDEYQATAVLRGNLIKMRNGKQIAKIEAKFGVTEGC